jgi:heat-inducible transcriptional repressor
MEDRKLAVLRAIVEDYIQTSEPVGSKALADRHQLGVSSATIRNDMAALEEEGLISAPHTSAGRIPTDAGYRMFVDKLSTIKPLSSGERKAIQTFLDQAVDLDDVMGRTVRLLAQLTKQVALVQYPSLGRSAIRHIELVTAGEMRLLLIVIADTGRIEQRVIDSPIAITDELLGELRTKFNSALDGQYFTEVPSRLVDITELFAPETQPLVASIVATLIESVVAQTEERVVVGGTSNLTRIGSDFLTSVGPVLEALEEHVVLLRLLGEAAEPDAIRVRIGHENPVEELHSSSVVTVGYGSGAQSLAHMGVLGPTRMDYAGSMTAVQAVAKYVGQILMGK